MELGKNIAALRRDRGLTQEQLGKLLNVSGQAVSKWENGGTPDAEMLPLIADAFGVTVDSLFGRADKPAADITETLLRWLVSVPEEKRMYELFRLLCYTFQRPYFISDENVNDMMCSLMRLPVKSCFTADISGRTNEVLWFRSAVILNEGIQLAVPAEDCPMFLLMPEPENGYESFFTDNDSYRGLFYALSLPGALEILRTLYANKTVYRSSSSIAKAAGLPLPETEKALDALAACNILQTTEVELEDGPVQTYSLKEIDSFAPFMLFSRWICEKRNWFTCYWYDRDRPLLK